MRERVEVLARLAERNRPRPTHDPNGYRIVYADEQRGADEQPVSEARDDGRPSARFESALPPPRNDVYRLLTGEVRALIPAGNERMARRKRRCESVSPTT